MKILIIGAKGMLGQALAQSFAGYSPILWDRDDIDITDKSLVLEKVGKIAADVVMNVAAYNDVDGAENNSDLAAQINGKAVGYLGEAVRAYNGILVHYSTDYVFKGNSKKGYSEGDQPEPQSAYARSKYLGERRLQESGVKYYLIRTSRLFGKPAMSAMAKKSFVDVMLSLAQTKSEINAVDAEYSCPTYVVDLAEHTKMIIEKHEPFGVYHLANTGACTWYEFAKEIFAQKGIHVTLTPVPSGFFPRPAIRPAFSELHNTKVPLLRTWQDALKEYLHGIYTDEI